MNYEDYIKLQIGGEGHLNKPIRYAKGEQRAIDWFFTTKVYSYTKILDVGCGEGWGLLFLYHKAYDYLYGIDLHPEKIEYAKLKNPFSFIQDGNFLYCQWDEKFDLFWCSHSLEHFLDVDNVLIKMADLSVEFNKYRLFVVLPYPDLDPAPAHTSSVQLGLNIEDGGKTVIKFFEDRGFKLVRHKFDDYREPEIWLDLIRDNG